MIDVWWIAFATTVADNGPPDWIGPTVVSSAIAGGVALATHFSAQRAQRSSKKEDIRNEAYDTAKDLWTDTIAEQKTEIADLRREVTEVRVELATTKADLEGAKGEIKRLNEELDRKYEELRGRDRMIRRLSEPDPQRLLTIQAEDEAAHHTD